MNPPDHRFVDVQPLTEHHPRNATPYTYNTDLCFAIQARAGDHGTDWASVLFLVHAPQQFAFAGGDGWLFRTMELCKCVLQTESYNALGPCRVSILAAMDQFMVAYANGTSVDAMVILTVLQDAVSAQRILLHSSVRLPTLEEIEALAGAVATLKADRYERVHFQPLALAYIMGQHPRLGAGSAVSSLDAHCTRMVVEAIRDETQPEVIHTPTPVHILVYNSVLVPAILESYPAADLHFVSQAPAGTAHHIHVWNDHTTAEIDGLLALAREAYGRVEPVVFVVGAE